MKVGTEEELLSIPLVLQRGVAKENRLTVTK